MASLIAPKESESSKQISGAKREIIDYLNAGSSLGRWEYFIKCLSRSPGATSEYRTADLKSDIEKMVRFQPDHPKVLRRILDKYGIEAFILASSDIFARNINYPYFREAFGMKVLVRN